MKIAVIEHRLRGSALEDVRALAEASKRASAEGAEVVFLPFAQALADPAAQAELGRLLSDVPGTRLVPKIAEGVRAQIFPVTDQIPVVGARLGRTALIHGDACMNPSVLESTAAAHPSVLVMTPMSENELQAEAVLELAIGLSESAAGLIVVAEAFGAPAGEAGHGGSAIVMLGEILAEAIGEDDDLLLADVPEPVPHPEPPEPVPAVPTILAQRLATHQGRKLDMGYPADLGDGPGPR